MHRFVFSYFHRLTFGSSRSTDQARSRLETDVLKCILHRSVLMVGWRDDLQEYGAANETKPGGNAMSRVLRRAFRSRVCRGYYMRSLDPVRTKCLAARTDLSRTRLLLALLISLFITHSKLQVLSFLIRNLQYKIVTEDLDVDSLININSSWRYAIVETFVI